MSNKNAPIASLPSCTLAALPAALLLSLVLSACGGDSSPTTAVTGPQACATCTANALNGVAASGAPLANASVTVIDSTGARKTVSANASGAFSVPVAGMTAPFVIEATGSVGGQVLKLHSPALAADVGANPVNVTPLTEIMTGLVLGGVPLDLLSATTVDLSKITSTSISGAQDSVRTLVLPVLQAAGAGSADLRTAAFTANGAGMDLALDGLQVALVDGSYTVSTSLSAATASVTPGQAASAPPLTVPSDAATLLGSGTSAGAALATLLSSLTAQFAGSSLPTASALRAFVADDMLHDGQDADGYVNNMLLQDGAVGLPAWNLIGATFDQLQVLKVVDANNVQVRYRVQTSAAIPGRPWSETMYARLVNGKWLLRGDQQQFGAGVSVHATLGEAAATVAEMQALGATLQTYDWGTYYELPVKDSAGNLVAQAWLGVPGVDDAFGRAGWIGGSETDADTRLMRATYPLYFAHPDSEVQLGIDFTIYNNRVAARIASVTVTGPGLPAQGLVLTRTPSNKPSGVWSFVGPDDYLVNEFSDYACLAFNHGLSEPRVANCKLDWSQVKVGALYTFVASDSGGAVVDTVKAALPAMPSMTAAQLLARKTEFFPQVAHEDTKQFAVTNVYNDAGNMLRSKGVSWSWTMPSAAGMQLNGAWFFEQGTDETGAHIANGPFVPMYGKALTTVTFPITVTQPLNWIGGGVTVFDATGNLFEQRVDGNNHY